MTGYYTRFIFALIRLTTRFQRALLKHLDLPEIGRSMFRPSNPRSHGIVWCYGEPDALPPRVEGMQTFESGGVRWFVKDSEPIAIGDLTLYAACDTDAEKLKRHKRLLQVAKHADYLAPEKGLKYSDEVLA